MESFSAKLLFVGVGFGLLFAGGNWVSTAPGAGAVTWLAGLGLLGYGLSLFAGGGREHYV